MTMRTTATMCMAMAIGCGPEVIDHGSGQQGSSSETTDSPADSSGTTTLEPTGADDAGDTTDTTGTTGEVPVPEPGEGPFGSGTRLRAVVERTDDGVTQLHHWYDVELGIDCELARDSVGDLRCMPRMGPGVAFGWGTETCEEPIVGGDACHDVPTYVRGRVVGSANCAEGARHQGYLRGEPIGSGPVQYYSDISGTCGSSSSYTERFGLTPVEDAAFVRATAAIEEHDGFRIRVVVAEDGAYVRDEIIDPTTDVVCARYDAWTDEGTLVCSQGFTGSYGYSDAACSESLTAYPLDETCEQPTTIPLGPYEGRWYAAAPPWEGSIFTREDGACTSVEVADAFPFELLPRGREIDEPVSLHRPLEVIGDDAGRVRRRGVLVDGEPLALPGLAEARWYDAVLEQPCTSTVDDVGVVRCLPQHVLPPHARNLWGDPACVEIPLMDTVGDPGTQVTLVRDTDDTCGVFVAEGLQNVVGPWEGELYRLDAQDGCVVEEPPQDFVGVYRLGNYADLVDAPRLELVTAD